MYSGNIKGNIVNIFNKKIEYGEVSFAKGKILKIAITGLLKPNEPYILPGFIDSHVHVESSMLVPSEFAKLAVVHGTTGSINDPHEIANVCGMDGVKFMIENGKTVPFKFHFGAPSCVPATVFETAGAKLDAADVKILLDMPEINYLSEMMNFPGVLFGDDEVMKKISLAKERNKPVDGHAPGLRGENAKKYIDAGISTDHECFTAEEALEKLNFGMKILIREGSAAKNFEALIPLMHEHFENIMFCSDDKHPDSLELGHINQICARAVAKGIDVFKVLQAACINPVIHYNMRCGLLRKGDSADFIVVNNLIDFKVLQTYIDGNKVAENGKSFIKTSASPVINKFNCNPKTTGNIAVNATDQAEIPVIVALDGQLITEKLMVKPLIENGKIISDIQNDILKIVVINRYKDAPAAVAFIKNTSIKQGAIASSVAHDSHNIVAVGVDDESICNAINLVIQHKGGVSAVNNNTNLALPLPVAGLMSNEDGYKVAADYTAIDKFTKEVLGSTLTAPFMTLSFMALLVIPHLKLSDKGLFDGNKFEFVH